MSTQKDKKKTPAPKASKTKGKRSLLDVLKMSIDKTAKKLRFVQAQVGRFEHKNAATVSIALKEHLTSLADVNKSLAGIPADLAPISRKGQLPALDVGAKVTIREKFKQDYKDVVNGKPLTVVKQPGRFVECTSHDGKGIMILRGHLMAAGA